MDPFFRGRQGLRLQLPQALSGGPVFYALSLVHRVGRIYGTTVYFRNIGRALGFSRRSVRS
jgi:hypothetical protein